MGFDKDNPRFITAEDTKTALSGPTEAKADTQTLTSRDYCSSEVFELERERIFHSGWCFVGHRASIPKGSKRVVQIAGEDIILTRDRNGALHAFANTCRHRGALLCDPTDPTDLLRATGPGSIQCPYHAWTYSLDGRLLSTPRVAADEIDRSTSGLWPYRVDIWNGLVFVSLSATGPGLSDWIDDHSPGLRDFAAISIGELELVHRTVAHVAANWKIIIENYKECLHCPIVHPELVDLIPLYRTGDVVDPERVDGAVELSGDATSFSETGDSELPILPGVDPDQANLYRGVVGFPNLFVDVTGTGVILTTLLPTSADHTTVVTEYLFAAAAGEGSNHDFTDVVAFSELVAQQDYEVCERVQKGVSSQAFTSGILTEKDAGIADFVRHYRAIRRYKKVHPDPVYARASTSPRVTGR